MANPLIGKTLTAIWLAEDKKAIKFDVGNESIEAKADGDCCSSSWIENIENPEAIIGSPILSVEDLDMPDLLHEEYDDVTQCYGLKITSIKGTCTLDYRNESNGYYGGSLSWPGEYFYGGVYGQNVSKEEWKKIA